MTKANDPKDFFPKSIETEQLILRPIRPEDRDAYFALYSDPEVMRGWGTKPHETPEETARLIESLGQLHQSGDIVRWGIYEKANPLKLCGDVGYWRFVKVRSRGELGAKLARAHWKKGWMTEALSSVIHYGFQELGLNSVEGNIDVKNLGSIRLVEKIGFARIGVIPEHSFDPFEQRYLDTVLYTLNRSQWKGFPCRILPRA